MTDFMPRISIVVKYQSVVIRKCRMHSQVSGRSDGGNSRERERQQPALPALRLPATLLPPYIVPFRAKVHL